MDDALNSLPFAETNDEEFDDYREDLMIDWAMDNAELGEVA